MACDISCYAFLSNYYDGNKDISFQDPPGPRGGGIFFHVLKSIEGTYEMGFVFIDITMACNLSFCWGFFLTKTMEISKFHFRTTIVQGR